MLAPVSVVAAFSCPPDRQTAVGRLAVPICLLLTLLALVLGGKELSNGNNGQRSMLAAVISIFPDPVPYFDGIGSIPSYQQVGPYMTTWVMGEYHRKGESRIAEAISKFKPRFVIAQQPRLLDALIEGRALETDEFSMFAEDAEALHDNFIPHWGQLWIAGKTLEKTSGSEDSNSRRRPVHFRIRTSWHSGWTRGPTQRCCVYWCRETPLFRSGGNTTLWRSRARSRIDSLRTCFIKCISQAASRAMSRQC